MIVTTVDPFLAYAEMVTPAARRRCERKKFTKAEKAAHAKKQLSKAYRAHRAALETEILATSSDPDRLRSMVDVARTTTVANVKRLLEISADRWLANETVEVRYLILRVIGDCICDLRIAQGLTEFDDAIPGLEKPKLWERCRSSLI